MFDFIRNAYVKISFEVNMYTSKTKSTNSKLINECVVAVGIYYFALKI